MSKLNSTRINEFVSTDVSLFILRFFAGGFMLYGHGWGKMVNVVNGNFQFLDPIGLGATVSLILAAFAEGICSILVIAGFYTRLAAAIVIVNMFVAIFFHHIPAGDAFGGNLEIACLFMLIFTSIFLLGPGKFGIDSNNSR